MFTAVFDLELKYGPGSYDLHKGIFLMNIYSDQRPFSFQSSIVPSLVCVVNKRICEKWDQQIVL
jgi:hypothetical protein